MYNVIFASPLVLILLVASDHALLGKVQQWQQLRRDALVRRCGGAAMAALGAFILAL
jgi:hypothetical protein